WLLSALMLPLGAACSMNDASPASAGPPASGGSVAGQGNDDQPSSLTFDPVPDLAARAQATLKVHALPAKVYRLRFALPPSGGDPLDAVLDRSEADTDANGKASVLLTAPSSTTRFEVRVSAGSTSGSLDVNVKDTGFASVQVQPHYLPSVLRDITTWIATAHPDKTCADLPGIPPADGPLVFPPAAKTQAPLITVPALTKLAITLRSGHFVGGCTSIESLPAGPSDTPQIVQVAVLNRPIDLSASSLGVSLSLATPETTWNGSLSTASANVVTALLGTSTDDVDALLDTMRDESGAALQTLETTRKAEKWDDLLRAQWGANASTKLRDTVGAWLAAGRQKLDQSPHLLEGTLDPVHEPDPLDQKSALLTLKSAAGVDANLAGFVSPARVSWSANADDTLVIGTDVYVVQSQFAMALAAASALEASPDAATVADALSNLLDCAGLGSSLAAAGPDPLVAYADCDATCLETLCQSAVRKIWKRGAQATSLQASLLSITGTGVAHVGDNAEVAGMGGNWIGDLKAGSSTSRTGGTLTAATPSPP
ncbi:MAG TPA: hypothetical protein VNG33_02415, partial [Polyangiaceae bacterium]|nr:hypothetical protein [Polyangiaceae bacterium]